MLEDVVDSDQALRGFATTEFRPNSPNKCCETCVFYGGDEIGYCMNLDMPLVDFWMVGGKPGHGDPAEFYCNHWQQKEE